jgi:hypothetical protein
VLYGLAIGESHALVTDDFFQLHLGQSRLQEILAYRESALADLIGYNSSLFAVKDCPQLSEAKVVSLEVIMKLVNQ